MINYFEWPERRIAVTSLRLDTQNPRLTGIGKKITQPEIIQYLIEHENVIDLAKSIARSGYFRNEDPIVCKEDDRFVVLEGNRRICACKILLNPDLVKNDGKRSVIKNLLKEFDVSVIAKLKVIISPNREAADIMIVNRHTGGSVVEKWDKTKQDRFLYNRHAAGESIDEMSIKFSIPKSDIRKALQRYAVFTEILKLELEPKYKNVLTEEVKFSMTNVERVYDSKYGRDFLGMEFSEKGEIIRKLPPVEYSKRLKKVVEGVIRNEINSRTLNKEEDKKEYFSKLLNSKEFDTTIKPNIKYNEAFTKIDEVAKEDQESETPPKETKRNVVPNNKLFDVNLSFVTKVKRIDDIFNEIKELNIRKHPNAIAVLFRSYIDMVTYQFLKKDDRMSQLFKQEGEKIKVDNQKKIELVKSYIVDLGVRESKIDITQIQKSLKLKSSLSKDFIPSLRYMLDFLAKSELITEAKLKQSLQSHLNTGKQLDKVIGHNEFNLLVHNEYYTNDAEELKAAWGKLQPILEYMINDISSK